MTLFNQPLTLESLLARIEALEARVLDKPVRQCTEVPPELTESPLERAIGRIRQDHHFGQIDIVERDKRIREATERHRADTH